MTNDVQLLTTGTLRMADPRLPITVSKAAIELDQASRGEKVDFEATHRFSRLLQSSLEQPADSTGAQTVWLDANTVDVVGHALQEVKGSTEVRTVQDVFEQAWSLVNEMEKASETNHGDLNFDRLRRFCVAFGNSLLSRRGSMKHDSPTNPHRR